MTFEDTRTTIYTANIVVGRTWIGRPNFIIATEAQVPAANIEARMEFRDTFGGNELASMATTGGGTADGTITITALGGSAGNWLYEAECVLLDTVTNALEPSVNSAGALQQAGVGDLKLWSADVMSSAKFDGGSWIVRIEGEVTA